MKISLFLISASVIAYQLLLLHNLSITQWYHFASLIISVALLGFGASGSFLSLFRRRISSNFNFYYPLFLILAAIAMILSFRLIQNDLFVFDTYLVFSSFTDMTKLLLTYLILFIPFFFSASAIGLLFSTKPEDIGNLYFINLTGSAMGGGITLLLLNFFTPQQAVAVLVFLPVLAVFCVIKLSSNNIRKMVLVVTILTTAAIINLLLPPKLYLSEYKSLSKVMNMPGSVITEEQTSPYGLLQVVASPYIRYAPGLSLNYTGESGIDKVVFNNGNWIGPLIRGSRQTPFYHYSTLILPFLISSNENVLVLESGTGEAVNLALHQGAEAITAVESNKDMIRFLRQYNDSVYNDPIVSPRNIDPYAYLLTTAQSYDLIHLPLYDAFGGASGINALQEKPLLSQEAFGAMWNSLDSDGIVTISAWIDTPLRYPLRLLATMTKLLTEEGINNPTGHIIAIRNWSLITFIISKEMISPPVIDKVRDFTADKGFDILLLPGIKESERERFHYLSDKSLLELTDLIVSGSPEAKELLYSKYSFKISPVTENRPFPFHYIKISAVNELLTKFSLYDLPYLEIGYFLVVLSLLIVIIFATLFIILPLLFSDKIGSLKIRTFIYFLSLGLGFLMIEIVLIQHFITYLGTPLYSTTVIISTVLLFSGLGSRFSGKVQTIGKRVLSGNTTYQDKHDDRPVMAVLTLIIIFSLLYTVLLKPVLHATISFPFPLKIIITMMSIAPLAFIMGMPFPMGINHLSRTGEQKSISWAWGINGSMSVISSITALLLAVQFGFTVVMIFAACSYFLALFSVYVFRVRIRK